jgi:hypothetical protein
MNSGANLSDLTVLFVAVIPFVLILLLIWESE